MTKIFIILLLLFQHSVLGQTQIRGDIKIETHRFQADSINNSPNIEFNKLINLEQLDKSDKTFEVRLYTLHSLSNTKSVKRLYLIDNNWKADEYDEWSKPKKIKKYKLKAKVSYDSIFIKLLAHNIFTLPNQDSLSGRMKKLTGENSENGYPTLKVMRVTDGNGYTIEIKIGDKYRVYQFDNPDVYSKFYDDVNELKDYFNIVEIFKNDLIRK